MFKLYDILSLAFGYYTLSFFLLGAAKQAVETERGFLFDLRGLFLQSVGFPFDSQGPGSCRNVLRHY